MGGTETPARVVIRDEALRLFAEHGVDAVSLRQVAAAAGVSPGLVVHHFGGKDGLRAAVDEHAAGICEDVLREVRPPRCHPSDGSADAPPSGGASAVLPGEGDESFADALLRRLPEDSPVPAYLRRLLFAGDQAGLRVFRGWYRAQREMLDEMIAAGMARPSRDRAVSAAFLVVNDLATLLLREQLIHVLGVDPLTPEGCARWTRQALAVYRDGLLTEHAE
jgi:TetR/AcrR family transcriptional regulator, regulator of cefoperazone and chloramphenicol sensitivity